MSTQIFAKLIRDEDPTDDSAGPPNPMKIAKFVKDLFNPIPMRGYICGDSLDMPFIKWMNVTGLNSSIGFSSGKVRELGDAKNDGSGEYNIKVGSYGDDATLDRNVIAGYQEQMAPVNPGEEMSSEYRQKQWTDRRGRQVTTQVTGAPKKTGGSKFAGMALHEFNTNTFQNVKVPSHNDLVFTKNTDNATPQLAYACSSQEPIGSAFFAFRRKIGLGVRGIRVPFMVILLSGVKVSGWELDGDKETVTLKYKEIKWCTYDQVTDWNAPTGMSARYWDAKQGKGGEMALMYGLMAVLAGIVLAGMATDEIVTQAVGEPNTQTQSDADISVIE